MRTVFLAAIFLSACAHKQMVSTTPATPDAPIAVTAAELKPDNTNPDLKLTVANQTDKPVLIRPDDIHCARDHDAGEVHHGFGAAPFYDQIRLNPHESKTADLHCQFKDSDLNAKKYSLKVDKVYDNTDGNAPKELATNLDWDFERK